MAAVVEPGLCIGCGLCAALCPEGVLAMGWNRYGEYNPAEVSPCTTGCGLCAKVCPFSDTGEDEDTIGERLYGAVPGVRHRPETGYYLASYVGYSEKHRLAGASGGMATWLLEALLAEDVVDHVICVAPAGNPDKLFAFRVFSTPEDVRTGAGSAYYPVEMSGVVRQILETPGRYAVTGLPCFIKALRLAQLRNRKLRERVVVTVGLVCGQLKSWYFTDYIAALAGVRGEVTGVRYRGKSPDRPATDYHYAFTTKESGERRISWSEGIAEAWTNRWFTPKACSYCDDIFAECVDVTFMDAWLPEYSVDGRGTSLLLVRSPAVREMIERGRGVCLDPIAIEQVAESQAGVAAPTPTPVPTWDGKPQEIGFVDPRTYQIPTEEPTLNMTTTPPANRTAPGVTRWVTYATIDGQWSGTTGIVRIPFPMWRLDYSDITTSNDEIPLFNCQVMDAEDPNRFVRIFTLNLPDFLAMKDKPDLRKEQWVHTFYEGNHDYYFVINARCLDAYHVKVQVPETYVGT
jgi:coenzyme F420-reducing hydrogenase beta subunit